MAQTQNEKEALKCVSGDCQELQTSDGEYCRKHDPEHKCEKDDIEWDGREFEVDCIIWDGICNVCSRNVYEIYSQQPELYDTKTRTEIK